MFFDENSKWLRCLFGEWFGYLGGTASPRNSPRFFQRSKRVSLISVVGREREGSTTILFGTLLKRCKRKLWGGGKGALGFVHRVEVSLGCLETLLRFFDANFTIVHYESLKGSAIDSFHQVNDHPHLPK